MTINNRTTANANSKIHKLKFYLGFYQHWQLVFYFLAEEQIWRLEQLPTAMVGLITTGLRVQVFSAFANHRKLTCPEQSA